MTFAAAAKPMSIVLEYSATCHRQILFTLKAKAEESPPLEMCRMLASFSIPNANKITALCERERGCRCPKFLEWGTLSLISVHFFLSLDEGSDNKGEYLVCESAMRVGC